GAPPSARFGIQLEGGQRFVFKVSAVPQTAGPPERFLVDVSYSESAVVPAIALSARRFLTRVSDMWRRGPGRAPILSRPALAGGFTLVFAAAIVLYLQPWRRPAPDLVAVNRFDSPQPVNPVDGSHQPVPLPSSSPDQQAASQGSSSAGPERPQHSRNVNAGS